MPGLLLLLMMMGAAPQEDVVAARLRATVVPGRADVAVSLRYELVLTDETVEVPLRVLEVAGTRVENLTVNGVPHALDRGAAPRLEAAAPAPAPAPARDGVLELTYDVRGAVTESGVHLPVFSVGVAQSEARPGTFRDDVTLPPELRGLSRFPPSDELPVVPAFVAFGSMPATPGSAEPDRAPRGGGFVFWGLFAVFGAIVLGYAGWMRAVERPAR